MQIYATLVMVGASLGPLELFRKRYARANVISIALALALALKKYFALALTQAIKRILFSIIQLTFF